MISPFESADFWVESCFSDNLKKASPANICSNALIVFHSEPVMLMGLSKERIK
jgi:hypothetical protein